MTPRFLAAAINKAQSTDPVKVAHALEDLTLESVVGPVRMRGEDHQLLLPQVVNTIAPVDGKAVKVGWEGTNYGFRTDAAYTGNELAQGIEWVGVGQMIATRSNRAMAAHGRGGIYR